MPGEIHHSRLPARDQAGQLPFIPVVDEHRERGLARLSRFEIPDHQLLPVFKQQDLVGHLEGKLHPPCSNEPGEGQGTVTRAHAGRLLQGGNEARVHRALASEP